MSDTNYGERGDYPVLQGTVTHASGAALSTETVERMIAYFKSPEYQQNLEAARRRAETEHRAAWERMERGWLKLYGATEMTPDLREKMDDEIWDWFVRNTNILEVLS